jgi:hypothetical protein
MAVAHDAVSTYGSSGAANVSSFQWTHTPTGTPKGAVVFVNGQNLTMSAMVDTAVTYGGVSMTKIPYTAFTTSTERGSVSAYFLADPPSGAQTVVVTRTNNNVVTTGVCCTVTADYSVTVPTRLVRTVVGAETPQTGASSTGSSVASSWSSLTTIGDGSPGTNSQRYLSVYTGYTTPPAAGTNATLATGLDLGAMSWSVLRETTPSQGDVTLGVSVAISDDIAAMGLAIKEKGLVSSVAQAQASITASSVTVTYEKAQAQATIKQTYSGYGQSNASILSTYYGSSQAQTTILLLQKAFAQTQASIILNIVQSSQTNAYIKTINYSSAQTNALIKGFAIQHAQAEAHIKVYNQINSAQAQASILLIIPTFAQANALVLYKLYSSAQAQAFTIYKQNQTANTQASIHAIIDQYSQAQANIAYSGPTAHAQALAAIWNGLWLFTRGTNASGLTLNPTTNFSQDSLAVFIIAYGNYGSQGADQGCSVADTLGNTWTLRHVTVNDPNIVQGAGTVLRFFTTEQNVGLLTTGTTITATLGNGSIGQVIGLWEVKSNIKRSPRYIGTGTGATSNSTTPSVTSSTITVDDAIVGAVAYPYGESYATLDTDSVNGNWSGALSAWGGSEANGQSLVSQFKIQINTDSTQTYNPTYTNAEDWAAGWIAIRLIPYQKYAQAQARIRVFDNVRSAQTQAELIQGTRYSVHAQVNASIIPRFNVFAQAKTSVKTTYGGFAQAAARMAIYSQHGQAQTNIKTSYTGSGQAAGLIFNITKIQFAQAQALLPYAAVSALGIRVLGQVTPTIETTSFNLRILTNRATINSANAAAQIQNLTNTAQVFAQSIAYIKLENRTGFAQAQAWVRVFAVSSMYIRTLAAIAPDIRITAGALRILVNRGSFVQAQATALINSPIKVVVAQAHVSIYRTPYVTYNAFAQSQGSIKNRYTNSANARTSIKRAYARSGQAQAFISHPQAFAQARTTILRTGYRGYAQARTYMRLYIGYAQSQAYIGTTSRKHAQAAAYMRLYVGYGQAQARIKNTYRVQAQATTYIRLPAGFAQINADIKQVYRPIAQANTLIDSYAKVAFAQAQATLIFVGINSFYLHVLTSVSPYARVTSFAVRTIVNRATFKNAQAAASIQSITKVTSAQVVARIKGHSYPIGNANAYIRAIGISQSAQSMADILKLAGYGQSRAYLRSFDQPVFAQAQAYSLGETYTYGQAGGYIRPLTGSAHAQASIRASYRKFSQSQAMIEIQRRGYAHTSVWIINTTSLYIGVAQARIVYKITGVSQAISEITRYKFGWANAMARISGHQHAQSQGLIRAISGGFAHSSAFIKNKYTTIIYNGYLLPGYLQKESFNNTQRIRMYESPHVDDQNAEYIGLENKIISLQLKLTGDSFNDLKTEATKASTMVWSARNNAKLYIHGLDKYYLASPRSFKIDNDAYNRTLDYTVDFTAQPWLYSDSINTITGTTSLVTTGRTIADGVVTPATIRISGTDVTVSGYTAEGVFMGYFATSGSVSNLIVDSENYSATINGVNKNELMKNLDYQIYVGQGVTYFDITGASSAEISWRNRW